MTDTLPIKSLFCNAGILVDIKDQQNFLKIKETLTRIGIAAQNSKTLTQSCHILHKRDAQGNSHYAIVHFKEMFMLDNMKSTLDETDILRRNKIVALLEDWNLLSPLEDFEYEDEIEVKVISHKEKSEWKLVEKYKIGKKPKKG